MSWLWFWFVRGCRFTPRGSIHGRDVTRAANAGSPRFRKERWASPRMLPYTIDNLTDFWIHALHVHSLTSCLPPVLIDDLPFVSKCRFGPTSSIQSVGINLGRPLRVHQVCRRPYAPKDPLAGSLLPIVVLSDGVRLHLLVGTKRIGINHTRCLRSYDAFGQVRSRLCLLLRGTSHSCVSFG